MSDQREKNDLPEGVIDAEPAGGWESGDVNDGETRERLAAEAPEAALPSDADEDADGPATGYSVEAVDDVDAAEVSQGVDADLSTGDGS